MTWHDSTNQLTRLEWYLATLYLLLESDSRKIDQTLLKERFIMATQVQVQADLDALKAKVEAIPARVLAAIQAAGPVNQAQLDAFDAEVVAIGGEADAVAPAPVVTPDPAPVAPAAA